MLLSVAHLRILRFSRQCACGLRSSRTVLFKLFFSFVPLSQYKTCTRTTITIQNIYTYHCHNTKHVHVPLSQYKACTLITVVIQNMYTYYCHNTKHVHIPLSQYKNILVPLSQYKTCTRTTVTIQNMYT
jgi:hypothetical protein